MSDSDPVFDIDTCKAGIITFEIHFLIFSDIYPFNTSRSNQNEDQNYLVCLSKIGFLTFSSTCDSNNGQSSLIS